jgi:hypothetical protein
MKVTFSTVVLLASSKQKEDEISVMSLGSLDEFTPKANTE